MPLPTPSSHILIDNLEVELFRCEADGGIVIRADGYDNSRLIESHAGHKLRQPVILTEVEIEEILDELKLKR